MKALQHAWTSYKDYDASNEAFLSFIRILASDQYAPENLEPYAWDSISQALEEGVITAIVDFLDKHALLCSLVLRRLAKYSAYSRKQLGLECNMDKLLRMLNEAVLTGFSKCLK